MCVVLVVVLVVLLVLEIVGYLTVRIVNADDRTAETSREPTSAAATDEAKDAADEKREARRNPKRWRILFASMVAASISDLYLGLFGNFFVGEAGQRGAPARLASCCNATLIP